MTETPEQSPEREIGAEEQAILDRFVSPGWRPVSFEQLGPDGTETLAMLIFHLCPVCAACIPLGSEEDPFPDLHRDYHLSEAQALDETTVALKMLLSMAGVDQPEAGWVP